MAGRRRRARGFTLIELMVVISILGLLAGIAVVQYRHTIRRNRENILKHNVRTLNDLLQQYKVDKKVFAPAGLQDLVDAGYLKAIPKDPITNSADTWVPVANVCDDPDDPSCDAGIVSVQSGAPGSDLDGTPFVEYQ